MPRRINTHGTRHVLEKYVEWASETFNHISRLSIVVIGTSNDPVGDTYVRDACARTCACSRSRTCTRNIHSSNDPMGYVDVLVALAAIKLKLQRYVLMRVKNHHIF